MTCIQSLITGPGGQNVSAVTSPGQWQGSDPVFSPPRHRPVQLDDPLPVVTDFHNLTLPVGVAFNSTFVALVISIFLMFFVHQLQLLQERLVLDSERYVDHWLVRKLRS